jgi:predicted house-cleaning noncanonical NTP pyrophosphatase (MazG superfamily)
MSLDDRQNLLQQGILWKKSLSGDLYPFRNLKKKELEEELEARSVEITDETKPKLVEHLNDILHGICRPPALMLKSPTKSSKELYIDDYEILGCEPLHDITNIIQHLIEELPYHIENLEARRDLEKFASNTIGEKNQIKGSDARLYAVKLAMFITTKDISLLRYFSSKESPVGANFDDHQETLAVFSKYIKNWYGSLFPLHKYNCNVLHVVDHTQIAELVHHH